MALPLAQAEKLAAELVSELGPVCHRIDIVGSIRRRVPEVKDIDLVIIPGDGQGLFGNLDTRLRQMGCQFGGPKIRRLVYKGAMVDIYIATPETWATLLLIRTGPTRQNVRLCARARSMGMQLKAGGQGLVDDLGHRVAGVTEASIFEALGLPYREPWERE